RSYGNELAFSNTWSWSEVVNRMVGRNSLKFGGEFRVMLNNVNNPTSSLGQLAFTPTFTQANPLSSSSANGNAMASLLLGLPNSGSVPLNAAMAYNYRYYGAFVQDDWRLARNVTLSGGLRWDYESPVTERYDRQNAGFDTTSPSPLVVPGMNL